MGDFDRNAGRRSSGSGRFDRNRPSFDRRDRGRGGDRDGGRFSGRDRGRDRRTERHEMHPATCDKCGKDCEVPFKPTEGKPIYCDDCFKDKSREAGSRSEMRKPSSEYHDQINKKLDRILKILEEPIIEKEQPEVKEPKKKEKPKSIGKEQPQNIEKEEPVLEYAPDIEEKKPKKKKAKKKKAQF